MRSARTVSLLAVIVYTAYSGMNAAADPPDRSGKNSDEFGAIRKLLEEQAEAWNKGDLEGFMKGYWKSPELTFYSGRNIEMG